MGWTGCDQWCDVNALKYVSSSPLLHGSSKLNKDCYTTFLVAKLENLREKYTITDR